MKELPRTQFGDPILRKKVKRLAKQEIASGKVQRLIADMKHTLTHQKLGVGLAAPQVNESVAIVVIAVHPTAHRPNVKSFDLVLINPVIMELSDTKKNLWEGCLSAGSLGKADLFAKVPRSTRVTVKYLDETGQEHESWFTGLPAQIVQHEVDHLHGMLFVDRVADTKTYMTYNQYMQRSSALTRITAKK